MPLIEVTDLRKSYGSRVAVDGVSFTVERGEIFGILGATGAGKPTTVECLQGLRQAGVQLQESRLPAKLRVREALELFASFYPDPADVDVLLDQVDLRDHARVFFGLLFGG